MFCFEEISPLNVNWSHKHKQENAKILLMNLWFMFWYTNFFPVTLRWEKTFKRFRYLSFKTSLFVLIHYLNILRFKHWPTLWKETQSRVRRRSFQLQRGHGFSDLILFQKYIKPKYKIIRRYNVQGEDCGGGDGGVLESIQHIGQWAKTNNMLVRDHTPIIRTINNLARKRLGIRKFSVCLSDKSVTCHFNTSQSRTSSFVVHKPIIHTTKSVF